MSKVVPIILANNADSHSLADHNVIRRLTDIVALRNKDFYYPALILATTSAIPSIHNATTKQSKIDFDHIYGCEGCEVSLFALLATARIANEKYPDAPILALKSTMLRDKQNDHTRDVKSNIPDAQEGHIITFSSVDHMQTDAMFTYQGLSNVCSLIRNEAIDIDAHWPEYPTARNHSRGRIPEGPRHLVADAHDMIEFKLYTKEFLYTNKKPELYTPWKTYDEIRAFSA